MTPPALAALLAPALAALLAPQAPPPAATPAASPAARAAAAPAPAPARPPAPPGLSWEDADVVATTVARIERRLRSGRPPSRDTVVVTEKQLNSYVNLSLAQKVPEGVSELRVRLLDGAFGASAIVDLDRVKSKVPPGASGMLAFLSGAVPVELRARLVAVDGTGRIEVEEASVGGVGLPPALVAQLVSLSTRNAKRPQGFDLLAPFPLAWKARSVRLAPGRALVDFAP